MPFCRTTFLEIAVGQTCPALHVASSPRVLLSFECRVNRCQASIFIISNYIHFFPNPQGDSSRKLPQYESEFTTLTYFLFTLFPPFPPRECRLISYSMQAREIIFVATITDTTNEQLLFHIAIAGTGERRG